MEPLAQDNSAVSLLYVEDDPVARNLVCSVIAKKLPGVVLSTAENGEIGLKQFAELRHDIVLTDICLPVMDGIEMARRIRVLNPGVQIIAATAASDTQHLLEAIKIGVSRYVLKPIDFHALFEAIEDCLTRVTQARQIQARNSFIRQLSHAVEQSPSMVMITNPRGVISYVNHKYSEITGYLPADVIGRNLQVLLTGIPQLDTLERIWSSITAGVEWRGELVNRKKDGSRYHEALTISPLTGEDGGITSFVAVMEDISERKQFEEQICSLNGELERLVKERTVTMEATNRELETFCYSVAHDLSTPLRGICGFSSILLEEHADQLVDAGRDYLERICASSRRMGQLIDALLNLSRVTRGKLLRERLDLSTLALQIVAGLRKLEPERQVEVAIAGGLVADGDPALVGLLLQNLLDNAWKYTGKKSPARIELGRSILNDETSYCLRDNGVGFDMAYVHKLFVPFERLHGIDEFAGTGVGLATVQRIVARHGGRVWAEGEVDNGAAIYFTLA